MKKILIKILAILFVLFIIVGGVFLIKNGIANYNNNLIDEDKNNSQLSVNVTIESLEEELSIVNKDISKKIDELNLLKNDEQIKCDNLKVRENNEFMKNGFSKIYYDIKRELNNCDESVRKIKNNISALEQGVSLFTVEDDIKALINNKNNLKSEVDKIKNPLLESNHFIKDEINWNRVWAIIEILGGIVLILVQILSIVIIYNKIVRALHQVENSFANIDVYLKKRWDLIPNIVSATKGYAMHEKGVFKTITALRQKDYNSMNLNEKVTLNNEMNNAILKIMILKESYPDLKANENFLNLSEKLSKIEDDIASFRIIYNNSVMNYNNLIKVFPNNIVVSFFNYNELEMFKTDFNEKENIKIEI